MEFPRFTASQLADIERRLLAAEQEQTSQMSSARIQSGEMMKEIEFHALNFIRRLLEDVKAYRQQLGIES